MTADQKVVADDVDEIRDCVCVHRDLRISGAALRCIDYHGYDVEHHAAHDNPEIFDCHVVCFVCRATQPHDRIRQPCKNDAEHNSGDDGQKQRIHQRLVRLFLIPLTLSSRHNRSDRHIHRDEHGKAEKFRLRRKTDRRHCLRADAAHHQRVDHAGQLDEKRFKDGRPGNFQDAAKADSCVRHIFPFFFRSFHTLSP